MKWTKFKTLNQNTLKKYLKIKILTVIKKGKQSKQIKPNTRLSQTFQHLH